MLINFFPQNKLERFYAENFSGLSNICGPQLSGVPLPNLTSPNLTPVVNVNKRFSKNKLERFYAENFLSLI
jgi:hypothetical protein